MLREVSSGAEEKAEEVSGGTRAEVGAGSKHRRRCLTPQGRSTAPRPFLTSGKTSQIINC